jgi:hypothetical protein
MTRHYTTHVEEIFARLEDARTSTNHSVRRNL